MMAEQGITVSGRFSAMFKREHGGHTRWIPEPVVCWTLGENGFPQGWILNSGRMVPASSVVDFDGYREDEGSPVVAALPAHGWCAVYKDEDGEWNAPIIAWRVHEDGSVTGVEVPHKDAPECPDPFKDSGFIEYRQTPAEEES